ncbi:MAG: exodeoxyribonuclease VII large subunit [Ruminococcus sp.]|nr:exodeoxyribonuclease VII large subunit [Ruminococcus sp.]MCM1381740.1 exodeoxyribonuclease VII large subunit [Muribaculaceae bacterium]
MSGILTVSQINRYVASMIRGDRKLQGRLVSGEISNFTRHNKTGHLYFTLKDSETSIKAVMFSGNAGRLMFEPSSGMKVIVSADVRVYERDGAYQLYVTDMQPDGLGALYLAFEQLKERLAAEGIFSPEHKKPIPPMPAKIGIVTSLDAAALQDMLKILSRRYPIAEVTVFPALVQGENAPASICKAVAQADGAGLDLIICGRGGGSPEDLAAFNTEMVARSIYACNTPIISAVGHETDTSIADYAADLRAATPSAAAELAAPDISVLFDRLNAAEKLLNKAALAALETRMYRLSRLAERLETVSPAGKLSALGEKISNSEKAMNAAYSIKLQKFGGEIAERAALLESLSPLKTLSRGYSLVYRGERLVNSVKALSAGDEISVRMSDGTAFAKIVRKEETENEI